MVLGTFWSWLHFCHDRQIALLSFNFIMFQNMYIFPTFFQCFYINNVEHQFSSFAKFSTRHRPRDAFQCGHVPKVSVCVTYFAPLFRTQNCSFSECSKYVMFSITFGPHVLQTTVCVTFWAHCRCAPPRLLGDHLATWAPVIGLHERPCRTWAAVACQDLSLRRNFALAQRLGLLKVYSCNTFNKSRVCYRSRVVLAIGGASMKCGVFTA